MAVPSLKTTLYANASFCTLSALVILIIPGWIGTNIIELPTWILIVLGIGLVLFAIDVFFTARSANPTRAKVLYIFSADVAWVILTPVVMLLLADRISQLGNFVLLDIAIIVAIFAALEFRGLNSEDSGQITEDRS